MPKKSVSQPTVPAWFPKLSETAPYTTVQIASEEVEDWLGALAAAFLTAESWEEIRESIVELQAFQSRQAESLAKEDWAKHGGHQLVWWLMAAASLQRAIDVFLPHPYDEWPEPVRAWLYLFQLVVLGKDEAERPGTEHPDHLDLARRAIHVRLAGLYAAQEVARRMKLHVGSPVGELLFTRELAGFESTEPLLASAEQDMVIANIMDKLRKCTWRKTQARLLTVVDNQSMVAETLKKQLSSEIYETVITRWGGLEGLDAVARSLDGKFNIAPSAVADRVMKQDRLRELFPFLTEHSSLPLPEDDNGLVLAGRSEDLSFKPQRIRLSITEEDSDHPNSTRREVDILLLQFRQQYPEHNDGIDLCLSDEALEILARARGVTVQTIINRKNRATKALKRFASEDSN